MKIYVVRHAIAEDRIAFYKKNQNAGRIDEVRPLTNKGKKEFERVCKKLRKVFDNIDVIFSSPLLRATQTAEILQKHYKIKFRIINELKPGQSHESLLKFLKKQKKENVMIVGHEPFLSEFVGYCVTAKPQAIIELKKGGLCILTEKESFKDEFVIKGHFSPKSILKLS